MVYVDRGGSNLVTCGTCRADFCWLCGMGLTGSVKRQLSGAEATQRRDHARSHFAEREQAMEFARSNPHLPVVWRAPCAGLMLALKHNNEVYAERTRRPPFGMAHPEVARGT